MPTLSELTAQIIAARVAKKDMSKEELAEEIQLVHKLLKGIDQGEDVAVVEAVEETPAPVNYKKAFKKDEVICLVCGKGKFKTLKKHLATSHNLTAAEYKAQFGIPAKQALVARSYSEAKKQVAIDRGLGQKLVEGRKAKAAAKTAKKQPTDKPF